ncbi:MAG: enoyl-CoA hydratase/isomerase family protein [Acidobacteria bacterium]|nr:enoyl-CoA hydratase/isomerase family protein [Acidobacteriota bacterium]
MPPSLFFHRDGPIARLELSAPDGFPRLTSALLDELDAASSQLLADPSCSALVLHGSDKAFAAGAEISELAALTGVTALAFSRRAQLLFDRLARSSKPVLAAIRGYCLGGGLDLALACHYRLAAPDAVFGHPGATLGLLTGWGGTQRLPRLLGRARAFELLLLGEPINAERALSFGLIDQIVPADELLARAFQSARVLSASSVPLW